jgi:hypothetical protein
VNCLTHIIIASLFESSLFNDHDRNCCIHGDNYQRDGSNLKIGMTS